MYIILSIIIALLIILIFFRRVSFKRFFLICLIYLLAFSFLFVAKFKLYNTFVVISNEKENFIKLNDQRKYDIIKNFFSSILPFFISDEKEKNDIFISSNTKTFNLKGNLDAGIDTIFHKDSFNFIFLRNYTKSDTIFIVKIFLKEKIYDFKFRNDTMITIKDKRSVDSVKILTNDQNPYNNSYTDKKKLTILLVDDRFSKELQKISLKISGLYDSVEFNTGFLRKDKIVSMKKDYDCVIYLGKRNISLQENFFKIKQKKLNIDFFKKTDSIMDIIKNQNMRIKNPFASKNSYKTNWFERMKLFFQTYPLVLPLFLIFFTLLSTLF